MYSTPHQHRITSLESLSPKRRQFYLSATQALEEQGFVYFADLENVTYTEIFRLVIPIRVLIGDNGETMAALYFKPCGFLKKYVFRLLGYVVPTKVIELSSEFSCGTFQTSVNTKILERLKTTPGISRYLYSEDTPLSEMLSKHREILASICEADPTLKIRKVTNLEEAMAMDKRQQDLKNSHASSNNYLVYKQNR